MSDHDDDFAAQVEADDGGENRFADYGDAATYTPPSGDAVSCVVIVDPEAYVDATPADGDVDIDRQTALVEVRDSELTTAEVKGRFAITATGDAYTIVRTPHKTAGTWECACERETAEVLAPSRRRVE